MPFNSIGFFIFYAIFFVLYWYIFGRSLKLQNFFFLTASYVFYAFWDWKFLGLLIVSSAVTYFLGHRIEQELSQIGKKSYFLIGIIYCIAILLLFKYYHFFIPSLILVGESLGVRINITVLSIVMPLGISFYTFRMLGYLFDIRNNKCPVATDWISYFAYVSFFPTISAGPVDKPKSILSQFARARVFDYGSVSDGARQITWGLIKKILVADNCAVISDQIFSSYESLPASTLALGMFLNTVQIYADVSGYSDIAIGLAKMLGFKITQNFNYPFFSTTIAEFWRRWHISITAWFTEYLFTPLSIALRNWGKAGTCLSIIITFLVIGIWHGSSATFLIFGLIHACYLIPSVIINKKFKLFSKHRTHLLSSLITGASMLGTFGLVMVSFVVFRSSSVGDALSFLDRLVSFSLFQVPVLNSTLQTVWVLLLAIALLVFEWRSRGFPYAFAKVALTWPRPLRWGLYYLLFIFIFLFGGAEKPFIYFQF